MNRGRIIYENVDEKKRIHQYKLLLLTVIIILIYTFILITKLFVSNPIPFRLFEVFITILFLLFFSFIYIQLRKTNVSQLYENGILSVRNLGKGIFIRYSSIYKIEESYKKSGHYTIHIIKIFSKQYPNTKFEFRDLCKNFPTCKFNHTMLKVIRKKCRDISWIIKE